MNSIDRVAGREILYNLQSHTDWKKKWPTIRETFDKAWRDLPVEELRRKIQWQRTNLGDYFEPIEVLKMRNEFYLKSALIELSERIGKEFSLHDAQISRAHDIRKIIL